MPAADSARIACGAGLNLRLTTFAYAPDPLFRRYGVAAVRGRRHERASGQGHAWSAARILRWNKLMLLAVPLRAGSSSDFLTS